MASEQLTIMTPVQRLAHGIKTRRKLLRMSQRDLAERAGTTQRVISLIEAERYNPTFAMAQALAGALNARLEVAFKNRR